MDDLQSSKNYCFDFSDIYNEETDFWDFLKKDEQEVVPHLMDSEDTCSFFLRAASVPHKESTKEICESKNLSEKSKGKPNDKSLTKNSCVSVNGNASTGESNLQKRNVEEDEDEFWSFLKPDNRAAATDGSSHGGLTKEELEEMKSLSSLTTTPCISELSNSEFMFSETSLRKINLQSNEDICRDLDTILNEINATLGELRKQPDKIQQSPSKTVAFTNNAQSNSDSHANLSKENKPQKLIVKDKVHAPKAHLENLQTESATILPTTNPSVGMFQRKIYPKVQSQDILFTIGQLSGKDNKFTQNDINVNKKSVETVPYVITNSNYLGNEKRLKTDNSEIKIVGSNSNIFFRPQEQVKFPGAPVGINISIKEQTNFFNVQSKAEDKEKPPNNLPVISSIFSISSCPNLFDNQECLDGNEGAKILNCFDVNTTLNNSLELSNTKPDLPSENNSSVNCDSFLETEVPCSTSKNTRIHCSTKQENVKRQLPLNSPKNSMFRVTDSRQLSSCQYNIPCITLADAVNNKRQKTNEPINNANFSQQGNTGLINNKIPALAPAKTIAVPTSLSNSTNTEVSNTAPLFLIVPKNSQPGQNQNTELVMIIGNGNLATNTHVPKTVSHPFNSTIPVALVTGVSRNTNASNNNQTTIKIAQPISIPTASLVTLPQKTQVPEVRNHLKPSMVLESSSQSTTVGMQDANAPTKSNYIPVTSQESRTQTNNITIYTVPVVTSKPTASQANTSTLSVLTNNLQTHNIDPKANNQPSSLTGLLAINILPSNPVIQPVRRQSMPIQPMSQIRPKKFKPLTSIALGKDKNAIQQISVPLKMENVIDLHQSSFSYDNLVTSNSGILKVSTLPSVPEMNSKAPAMEQPLRKMMLRQKKRVYDFVSHKPKTDAVLVKKNIITNEMEVVSKNKFFSLQPRTATSSSNYVPENKATICASENSNNQKFTPFLVTSTSISNTRTNVSDSGNGNKTLNSKTVTTIADTICTKSEKETKVTQKSALVTLQELFPPPISMIPVCVMETVPTTNKPAMSKVLVVQQSSNSRTNETQSGLKKNQGKISKTVKVKKPGRKTVKELLQERYQRMNKEIQLGTKSLKPIFKLPGNGILVPTTVPITVGKHSDFVGDMFAPKIEKNSTGFVNSNKRPNIMILPSAAKIDQSNVLQNDEVKKDTNRTFLNTAACTTSMFDVSQDFLCDKMASKDCRPRYYDMCELRIGYFKVEDDVDSTGRFHSKFKVLFRKCMFTYDFPVMKCNHVDLSNCYSWEQMARIQVPFNTVEAMDMRNRHITLQVNRCPQVCLRRTQEMTDLTSERKEQPNITNDDSIWIDAVQNSSIHKVTLRKRQADNLKSYLCQYDSKFLSLFNMECNIGDTITNFSLFEEELGSVNLGKNYYKNKRNAIRRLPQWDKESNFDPIELMQEDDPLVSSSQVCSCRVSCKSLRCSCVKAAKSCSSGSTVCLCLNCDNPLNLLESLGMDLDFSLRDCCLFQNIYQIPKLDNFLQRNIKLSCCNTVARVMDCIPGTILCPNTDCNACLEFSWCRGIICYPERNPRNHCSLCGQCCFSNRRHCPVCNRCYVVTPKCQDCPNCRANGFALFPLDEDLCMFDGEFRGQSADTKASVSKPEIILLDSSLGTKTEEKEMDNKPGGSSSDNSIQQNEEQENAKGDVTELNLHSFIGNETHSNGDLEVKSESLAFTTEEKCYAYEENQSDMTEFDGFFENEFKSYVNSFHCHETEEESSFVLNSEFSDNLVIDQCTEQESLN